MRSILGRANLILLTMVIISWQTSFSKTYYVSPQGADSNAGTLQSPWKNLGRAIETAGPGDTIFMRGGTHVTDEVWIRGDQGMGGANGQYLTIKNYPGEIASVGGSRRIIVDGADFVRIEGLYFRSPYNVSGGGEYMEIVNNIFEGPQPRYGAIEVFANNSLIEGNVIAISGGDGGTQDHGIYLHAGHDNVLRNNFISGASGYGIHVYDAISSGGSEAAIGYNQILIEGNVILNCQLRAGLIIAPSGGLEAQNITIRNNTIANSGINGIRLVGNAHDLRIYNNTIWNSGLDADHPDDISAISVRESGVHDVVIQNNIIGITQAGAFHIQNREVSAGIVAERNLYWGSGEPKLKDVIDSASQYADPWFADPGTNDFLLASLSPAIDTGIDVGLPFLGAGPDLGAREFGIPNVAIAPMAAQFATVRVDSTASKTIQVSYAGNESLDFLGAALTGVNADEFLIESGAEPFTVLPGAVHDVTVKFHPTNVGDKEAVLQFKFSGAANDTALNVSLIGSGSPVDAPDLAVSRTAYDFGDVEIGTASSMTFETTNVGALDLQVTAIGIIGPDSTEFSIIGDTVTFVLAPGAGRDLTVNFSPASSGAKSATLRLESNDWNDPVLSVLLKGNGIAAKAPDVSVNSVSHDFGIVTVGDSLTYTLQIMNAGTNDLESFSTRFVGADSSEFSIAEGGAPFVLIPDSTRDLIVQFRPTTDGAKSSTLRLESNDPDQGFLDIEFIGSGMFATGVDENNSLLPSVFSLKQNYPNPFNPETLIEYELPIASEVRISIYDINGRELLKLVNEQEGAGTHTVAWDGKNELGSAVASGIYFYRIEVIGVNARKRLFSQTRKMVVLR